MNRAKNFFAGYILCVLVVYCGSRVVDVNQEKSPKDTYMERRSIQIISNVSCAELTRKYATQNLTDDELMEVLKQKGGEYLTEYMAKTTEEAKLMFRPLNKPHRPKPGKQPPNPPPGQLTPPPPRTDHGPYAPGIKPESSYLAANDLIKIFRQFAKIQRKCGMTVAKVPENIILSGETYGRKKRQSNSGSVTTNGSCVYRGTSDDGYLQMCTTCSTTTTLSDSYFPRVLNEVSCGDSSSSTSSSANDNGCLFVSGTANGQCRQQYIYVNMLRKTGKCSLVTNSDGNAMAVDEWELYTQPIHVSCECMVDERSFLSNFVTT